ncbi:ABC transporter ATP-binding protein [Candidatus Spongiihabitans sp.]|uniref:ABC transporter ATP-binding protein n=1 Tax=Candidatus Spongiihabitans sp. TaxID=3101308 RepID=UPI003C6FE6C1
MEQKLDSRDNIGIGVRLFGSVTYDGRCLFEGLFLELVAGQWNCLLGRSGVGKSTLLRLLAGLSTGGEFTGEIVAEDGYPVNDRISYMAQSDLLFPWLNVKHNVMLGQRLRGDHANVERACELIQRVGLSEHIDKRPHQLSGGMRQRVALARTLMEDTPVVLLDEPFSALDARTRSDMQELAFEVLKGKTVLLVTHDPAEAVRLSHHLYLMSEQGVTAQSFKAAEPIRAVDDTAMLKAQADLLMTLRGAG